MPTSITSITQGSEHLAVSVTISRVPIVTTVGPVPMTISRQALKSVVYRDRPPQSLQERNEDFLGANPGRRLRVETIMCCGKAFQGNLQHEFWIMIRAMDHLDTHISSAVDVCVHGWTSVPGSSMTKHWQPAPQLGFGMKRPDIAWQQMRKCKFRRLATARHLSHVVH